VADRLADAGDVDRAAEAAERALAATKTVAGDYSGASSLISLVRMLPSPSEWHRLSRRTLVYGLLTLGT
jgi:hypothetical protein